MTITEKRFSHSSCCTIFVSDWRRSRRIRIEVKRSGAAVAVDVAVALFCQRPPVMDVRYQTPPNAQIDEMCDEDGGK